MFLILAFAGIAIQSFSEYLHGGKPAKKNPIQFAGIPQHIIQRGNNREPCFLAEKDYQRYLDDLDEASLKFRCHVHLLATPMVEYGLSQMMQALGRRYVRYFNNMYQH